MGVSEIKRDSATGAAADGGTACKPVPSHTFRGGGIYCLRRNAMGYGLYQVGTVKRG